jgi:hypothetical protein
MGKRIAELNELQQKWAHLENTMPATDLQIHESLSSRIPTEEDDESDSHGEPWDEMDRLRKLWHWAEGQNGKTFLSRWFLQFSAIFAAFSIFYNALSISINFWRTLFQEYLEVDRCR